MRRLPTLTAGLLALALAACGDVPTQPAQPDAPALASGSALAVPYLYCEDTGGGGTYYDTTYCEANASGGTGTYSFDWDVITTSEWSLGSTGYMTGVCTDTYVVKVTVTDGSGATASRKDSFRCYASSTGGGGLVP